MDTIHVAKNTGCLVRNNYLVFMHQMRDDSQ